MVRIRVSCDTNGQPGQVLHADLESQSNWYPEANLVMENGRRQVSTQSAGLIRLQVRT